MSYGCLSDTSNPYEVILHVFCNHNLYNNVIKSIDRARHAREILGDYCLSFCNPCDDSRITICGQRILDIFENPCNPCFRCPKEVVAGLTIINAEFFASVFEAYHKAVNLRSESKLYCKTFKIPRCLFPNISSSDSCITLTGEQIIDLSCKALTPGYCKTMK